MKTATSKILRDLGRLQVSSLDKQIGKTIACTVKDRDILAEITDITQKDNQTTYTVEDIQTGQSHTVTSADVPDIPQDGGVYHIYIIEVKQDGEWGGAEIAFYETEARKLLEDARNQGYTARLATIAKSF